eukprot:scaffold343_cov584-Prasinococcus_capsulatus_cf.AAC.8
MSSCQPHSLPAGQSIQLAQDPDGLGAPPCAQGAHGKPEGAIEDRTFASLLDIVEGRTRMDSQETGQQAKQEQGYLTNTVQNYSVIIEAG